LYRVISKVEKGNAIDLVQSLKSFFDQKQNPERISKQGYDFFVDGSRKQRQNNLSTDIVTR